MASAGVRSSVVRQPSTTTLPPRPSTAAIRRSGPIRSLRRSAKSRSTIPSRKRADPRITFDAPSARVASARSRLRMPPPTRQGSTPQMCATSPGLSPAPFAASRSISCTFGRPLNRVTHASMSSVSMASRSPWTSWTILPPWRSIEGISIGPESPWRAGAVSGRRQRARSNGRRRPPARRPRVLR